MGSGPWLIHVKTQSPVPRLRLSPAKLEVKVNNAKSYSVQVGERTLTLETGQLAMQAGGAVLVRLGDSVVLCTATSSAKPREGIDFFPLTVDFEER